MADCDKTTLEQPLDRLEGAILFGLMRGRSYPRPGAIIERMGEGGRTELQKLTSDMTQNQRVPREMEAGYLRYLRRKGLR